MAEPLRFRCTAEDPRGESIHYAFDWQDGSGEVTDSGPVASGTPAEVTRTFTRAGSFQARCRAVKASGLTGDWSEPVGYTVEAPGGQQAHVVFTGVYGRGEVLSTPEGIHCPIPFECSREFPVGTRVTLRPVPDEGWRFVGWWQCEGGPGAYEFTLERSVMCLARFAPTVETSVLWQRTGARLPASPVWNADGTRLAAMDSGLSLPDGRVRIWDAESGRVVRLLSARPLYFTAVAWHPSGPVLALGRSNGSIALIDSTTGAIVREWQAHPGKVRALAWRPDGARLASADDASKEVRLWNVDTGAQAGEPVVAVDKVRRLAWSPDGSRLALEAGAGISSSSQWVELHALGAVGLEALWTGAASFAWSPDGQRYAVGLQDEVRVYVTATHDVATSLRGAWSQASLLDWSRDGRWLAVGNATRSVLVLEVATSALVAAYTEPFPPGTARGFDALRFHPSKPELALVDDLPSRVDILTVDEAAGTVRRRELLPHFHDVGAVAWSPTGDRLASGGLEGMIRLWDSEGAPLRALSGHGGKEILSLAWDSAGTRIASGGADGRICIWRAEDGEPVREPLVHVSGQAPILMQVNRVALSPDGRRVASVAGSSPTESVRGTIRVWDVDTGEEVFRFTEAGDWTRSLAWTPDGRYLVAAYHGATWSLWDSQTGELRFVDPQLGEKAPSSALSPDGARIAMGHRSSINVLDTFTGARVRYLDGPLELYALAWSANGQSLVGGGEGGLVSEWKLGGGSSSDWRVIGFHAGLVSSASWRPDGSGITTGGTDGALVTWRPRP
ncbi:WD40 repeat domain-containing protein [Pyxidicoccus sp. 3LG]